MKLKPIIIPFKEKTPIYGDIVSSVRYKEKLLIFGHFENSYPEECTVHDLILIDFEQEITEGWKGYAYKKDVKGLVFKHFYTTNKIYDDAEVVVISTSNQHDLPKPTSQSIKWLIDKYNQGVFPEYVEIDDSYLNFKKIIITKIKTEEDILYDLKESLINSEIALQQLSEESFCPNLINDDNGHWAVTFDGMQNVPLENEPGNIASTCFIEKRYWKDTIKEALIYSLEN